MGLRSSKRSTNSYDVAPVVSNKDFSYERNPQPLPKVVLPPIQNDILEVLEAIENDKQEVTTTSTLQETITSDTSSTLPEALTAETPKSNKKSEAQDQRIPEWVNKANFKKLLLKTHPNIVELINFKAYPAIAAGENYATLMLRVKMTAIFQDESTKEFSFMLKLADNTKEMKDMLQAKDFFTTENTMYIDVLPELEEMYHQAGVEVSFGAKSHRLELEDDGIHYVLLDDLGLDGFKNANRLECLNMEHTLSVLRKMAQFHAASACRVAKKGAYPEVFSPDMDNEMGRAIMTQIFSSFKKPFLENLKTYHNGELYMDSMANFFDNLIELFIRSRKILHGFFNVLNHGDSWSNNILFKYAADGKLEQTLYVDFQNSNWGSPAWDLYYFIISSVQIDIKLAQFDYFIRYYHEHLTEHMKLLNYPLDIPSLSEFHIQLLDLGSMATITSFLTLGVVLLDSTDSVKFENFLSDSEESVKFKNSIYANERYRKYINEILPWLYNRGCMEINLTDLDNRIEATAKFKAQEVVRVSVETTKQVENVEQSSHSVSNDTPNGVSH